MVEIDVCRHTVLTGWHGLEYERRLAPARGFSVGAGGSLVPLTHPEVPL